MKQLIWVIGPQSSGTRYFTSVLIAAGAVGDSGHQQRLDALSSYTGHGYEPTASKEEAQEILLGEGYAVLRRSLPHGSMTSWPDIAYDIVCFSSMRIDTAMVFFILRDVWATCASMVQQNHCPTIEEALVSVRMALSMLDRLQPIPVCYERLGDKTYLENLFVLAGLKLSTDNLPPFKDENAKHYIHDWSSRIKDG